MTVLFADVCGSTTMGERLDPETVTEIMNQGFERLIGEVKRFGGTVGKLMGDGMIVFFGAPEAHEDDPERAIRAALAMQATVAPFRTAVLARHGVEYQIRVGINTGAVVAGQLGGAGSGEYTVMGDTVNTAARLESNAPVGGIRVGPETHQATRDLFEFGAVEYLILKGKAEPFPTYRVLGLAAPGAVARPVRQAAPLVGREGELAWLMARLADPAGGGLAVVGEAGAGKSRLVFEARRALAELGDGRRWAATRCASYSQESDYAALATLLHDLLNLDRDPAPALDADATAMAQPPAPTANGAGPRPAEGEPTAVASQPPLAVRVRAALDRLAGAGAIGAEAVEPALAVLGDVLGYRVADTTLDRLEPEYRRHVRVQALAGLLAGVARLGPVSLVVEDAQWLDAASAEVLARATQRAVGWPLQLLYLARPEAAVLAQVPEGGRQGLAPLEPAAAQALLTALTVDTPLPAAVAETVLARAGGNPLFLEELARTAGAGGPDEARLPSTLHELVRTRLDQLPAPLRQAAGVSAVLGRSFDGAVLRLVANPALGLAAPAADRRLRDLDERGVIEPDGPDGWGFRQAMTQAVAYEGLLLARRRELHTLAGAAIERLYPGRELERLDELERHFGRGLDHPRAIRYGLLAADRAAARFQLDHACRLYQQVLDRLDGLGADEPPAATERGVARVAALAALAAAEFHRADYAAAEAHCLEALDHLEPNAAAGRRAELRLLQAKTLDRRGLYDDALTALDAAVAALPAGDARPAEAAVTSRQAEIMAWRGWVLLRQGQPAATLACCDAALATLDAAGEAASAIAALAHNNAGAAHQAQGDLAAAAERFGHSLAINLRLGDPFWTALALHNLGVIAHTQGDLDAALGRYREALTIRERIGDRQGAAETASNLGVIEQDRGDLRAAAASFERVLDHFDAVGDAFGSAVARLNLAVIRRLTGDLDAALALGEEALVRFEPLGVPIGPAYSHAHLGATLRALGRPAEAESHLHRAIAVRQAHDLWEDGAEPYLELAELHGAAGATDAALAALAEAERVAALTGAPPWPLRCRLTRARLAIPADPAAATAELTALLPEADAAGGADLPVLVRLTLAEAHAAAGDQVGAEARQRAAAALAAERGLGLSAADIRATGEHR